VELSIDLRVVVVDVGGGELRVGPVDLPRRREVAAAVDLERAPLVRVGVEGEPRPVLGPEARRVRGDRRARIDGPVAGEHAVSKEALARGVGRELEVAVEIPVLDPPREAFGDVVDLAHLDDTLDLLAPPEPQPNGRDDAEQPVAADRETEELGVLVARAPKDVAARVDEREGLDVPDDRPEPEPASVHVRRERAAEAELVGAGLLLNDAPLFGPIRLALPEVAEELRPLDPRLDVDGAALVVEAEHASHPSHVHVQGAGAELLPAHGVPAPRNAHAPSRGPSGGERRSEVVHRRRPGDRVDPCAVELRVDVVEEDAGALGRGGRRDGARRAPSADGSEGDRGAQFHEISAEHGGRPPARGV
jgi:hypothetical protein